MRSGVLGCRNGRNHPCHPSPPHPPSDMLGAALLPSRPPGAVQAGGSASPVAATGAQRSGPRWSRTDLGCRLRYARFAQPAERQLRRAEGRLGGVSAQRRGAGGGAPAHLGPPPRSTAGVDVQPAPGSAPKSSSSEPRPQTLRLTSGRLQTEVSCLSGEPLPPCPSASPASSWLRPSLVAGCRPCPQYP